MNRLNLVCLALLYTCMAREPPTVTIPNQGELVGKEISRIRTQRIVAFLGIPYAQPPIERLRFAPPQIDPLPSWEGLRNATEFELPCLQTVNDFKQQDIPFLNLISPQEKNINISEDCLYLNVFKPYGSPPKGGFATIVWFHPGNFTTGNPTLWDPYRIVYQQRVIVVTFAWRMNIMGFFSSLDGEAPGNAGLLDQQAAMMWVKNNIKIFDGNAKNICLMGYGTGAMSIGLHMINPDSKNLFHKAIMMSGNFLTPSAIKYPAEDKDVIGYLSDFYGCYKSPAEIMQCLRRVDPVQLVEITSHVNWRPLIDRGLSNSSAPFLPEPPRNFYERGEYARIPVLTGYTNMEDVLSLDNLNNNDNFTSDHIQAFLNDIVNRDLPPMNESEKTNCIYNHEHIMDSVMFFYNPSIPFSDSDRVRRLVATFNTEKYYGASTILHANFMSRYKPTYVYRFDLKPATFATTANIPDWISVPHLFDLIFVWGLPYWVQLPENEWDVRDKRTSDIIMSFWANFAKSNDPTYSIQFPIRWDPYTKESPGILIIDNTFNMSDESRTNYKSFEFWNEYYPKVLELATQCCNATDVESAVDVMHRMHSSMYLFIAAHALLLLALAF